MELVEAELVDEPLVDADSALHSNADHLLPVLLTPTFGLLNILSSNLKNMVKGSVRRNPSTEYRTH